MDVGKGIYETVLLMGWMHEEIKSPERDARKRGLILYINTDMQETDVLFIILGLRGRKWDYGQDIGSSGKKVVVRSKKVVSCSLILVL